MFKLFDTKLQKHTTYDLTLPYKDKKTTVLDYYVSNKGNAFMLLQIDKEKAEKSRGEDDKFYSIISINLADKKVEMQEYAVELSNKAIKSLALRIDNKTNRILCSGFYSDIVTKAALTKDIDGFFYVSIDVQNKKLISQSYKELTNDIINQLAGKDQDAKVKEGKGISNRFVIRDYLKQKDGSSLIVAEMSWMKVLTSCNNGTCTYTYLYYRNNIFLVSISAKGEIRAFYDIPKKQFTINDNAVYSSFLVMQKDDNIVFVYNDEKNNLSRDIRNVKDAKVMRSPSKAVLTAIELLPDGSLKRNSFKMDKSFKLVTMPNSGEEIGKGQYVIPAMRGNKFALLKFEL